MKTAQPTLCLIHEGIGPDNAIAKIAMSQVRFALDAGWKVTVVAKLLDESLRDEVEWLKLYVPNRLFFVQWVTARRFIKRALGARTFDVIHSHQPQVASLSDIFQCHFLTRVAHERGCLESRRGLGPLAVRLQQEGVMRAEDWYFRHWNPQTWMVYNSELTQREFRRLYGRPPNEEVLLCPSPGFDPVSPEERQAARTELAGNPPGLVLGFLGGLDERKGYRRVLKGLRDAHDVFLLMGGIYSDGFVHPLPGGMRAHGLVDDTRRFYAACDALVAPSLFEPFGLVALEAAARGIPIIATQDVGALPHLMEYGVATPWDPEAPLSPIVREAVARRQEVLAGAARLTTELSTERQTQRLARVYEAVLRHKRSQPDGACLETHRVGMGSSKSSHVS